LSRVFLVWLKKRRPETGVKRKNPGETSSCEREKLCTGKKPLKGDTLRRGSSVKKSGVGVNSSACNQILGRTTLVSVVVVRNGGIPCPDTKKKGRSRGNSEKGRGTSRTEALVSGQVQREKWYGKSRVGVGTGAKHSQGNETPGEDRVGVNKTLVVKEFRGQTPACGVNSINGFTGNNQRGIVKFLGPFVWFLV